MKYIRILLVGFFLAPVASFAANEFMVAAQLLAAAKNADIQQVQATMARTSIMWTARGCPSFVRR